MSEPRCIPLDAIREEPVGGKAKGLALLIRLGFEVPDGFVLVGASEGRLPSDLDQRYIGMGGGKVAVRSSAIGEDSDDASFAGQYETVLNVEGLEALHSAIGQCLASVESARSSSYRNDRTQRDDLTMNVVVQRMVDARAAGVLFTADPVTARRDHVVVDAVSGLGEALVSGRAEPDHWLLRRNGDVVDRELRGTEAVLTEPELQELLSGAMRAEAKYGAPLDLEWAIARDGRIRWLQARPITKLPGDLNELDTTPNPEHVYTWCNIGEMMPGAVTPLTFSITGRGNRPRHAAGLPALGRSRPRIGESPIRRHVLRAHVPQPHDSLRDRCRRRGLDKTADVHGPVRPRHRGYPRACAGADAVSRVEWLSLLLPAGFRSSPPSRPRHAASRLEPAELGHTRRVVRRHRSAPPHDVEGLRASSALLVVVRSPQPDSARSSGQR